MSEVARALAIILGAYAFVFLVGLAVGLLEVRKRYRKGGF